jgi:hypothetical protein
MNDYLLYFPTIEQNDNINQCQALRYDQLCDIINLAKNLNGHSKMIEANVAPYDLGLHDLLDYLERLGLVDSLKTSAKRKSKCSTTPRS